MRHQAALAAFAFLCVLLLTVPAKAEMMNYSFDFTASNFSRTHGGSEPLPSEVTGNLVIAWDDAYGFSTASLVSLDVLFGSYAPTLAEVGTEFNDFEHFAVGGLAGGGIRNTSNNVNDFFLAGAFSVGVNHLIFSTTGQTEPTGFYAQEFATNVTEGPAGDLPAVPEPSTFLLMALGVLGALGYRRFRKC